MPAPSDIASDGTLSWTGGMDTSRSPEEIAENQYSKACNVIIPSSLGGISCRFGFHCASLEYESRQTENIFRKGSIQGEGYFESNGRIYAIVVIDGYVLKLKKVGQKRYYVTNINFNDRNQQTSIAWVITIPNGCIVNNGIDYPIHITENSSRRTNPSEGEIGISRMGVYVQNRLFYVDQSGRRVLASDFLQPTKFTLEGTNIFGFICPDEDEEITAITKQKSILNYAEGGNLIWSSHKDIYSADVRGTRSDWANLQSRVGKTTETVPGFSSCSSNAFESFNSNVYFRSKQYGIANIKQSEYQFVNLDTVSDQAIEASYYLDNDTDWMLDKCYMRSCNNRLFTTVAPVVREDGSVYWNGLLSFHPAANYSNVGNIPRRFESVFTGVRPWCITVIKAASFRDEMLIYSYDNDGVNRLYIMDENTNYDVNEQGSVVEIEGFIETKSYNSKAPFLLKSAESRFYRLNSIDRSLNVAVYSRPEIQGEWVEMWRTKHLVCRTLIEDGVLIPQSHKPQTRSHVSMPEEKFSNCYALGKDYLSMQYRFEFKGPLNLESIILINKYKVFENTVAKQEQECYTIVYDFLPDYNYLINQQNGDN